MVCMLRGHQVAMMLARLVEEGLYLEERDKVILNSYVRGSISSVDVLAHAQQFLTVASYHAWMIDRDVRFSEAYLPLSVEQVLAEFHDSLKRRSSDCFPVARLAVLRE